MQIKKIYFPVLLITCLLTISCSEKKKLYSIGFIQMTDDPVLDQGRYGVIEALKEAGYENGKNINIIYKNAQGDISNIPLILKSFLMEKVDMVITSTTPCMAGAAQFIKDVPVVFTVSFSPEQVGIKNPPKNLTGVYDPFDMEAFLNLIKEIKPGLNTAGIIYNSSEPNAVYGRNKFRDECIRQGINLEELSITSSSEVLQAAAALAQKNVEVIAVVADNTVNLALESVIKISFKNKIPIFETEASQVKKGALAGVGLNYRQWGIESGKIAVRIIQGLKPENIPIRPVRSRELILNNSVAQRMGITFPEGLLSSADEIIQH